MDPISTSTYCSMDPAAYTRSDSRASGEFCSGIFISGEAYSSRTQENSAQSGGGLCLWEPRLCFSKTEENGVQYHPGYLIFYPAAVMIIPSLQTSSFQASRGTGVFHPLSSIPSRDGDLIHLSQDNYPSFPRVQQIRGAFYLTEAATHTIGQHICRPTNTCKNQNVGRLESEDGVQNANSSSPEPAAELEGEDGIQNWPSDSSEGASFPEPTGESEGEYGVQSLPSKSSESIPRDVGTRSLPRPTAGKGMSSRSWNTPKARESHATKEEDRQSQDNLTTSTPTSTFRTILDESHQVTPPNKGKSQVDQEVDERPTHKGKFEGVDEEIEGEHSSGASVELEDRKYGAAKPFHLQCQVQRASCTHPCPSRCHSGDCPPCKVLVKLDCHCRAYVHSLSCEQFTSASETEQERICSCGGPCHNRLPNCAHMCSDVCHARPCQPSNCHKKVTLRCKCQRLKKRWVCCDVLEGKLWEPSSPQQKGYQRGEYIGLISCNEECSQSVRIKEMQNEAGIKRNGKEAQVCEAELVILRHQSFPKKVVIVLLAIVLMIGVLFRPVN